MTICESTNADDGSSKQFLAFTKNQKICIAFYRLNSVL